MTPIDRQTLEGPLNPRYTQQTIQSNLDTQPSRGLKKEDNLGDTIGAFMDEGYEDILRTSQLRTSFSLLSFNSAPSWLTMPLGWVVPDRTNRTLEEIQDKKIANGTLPGGGTGAIIVCLPNLEGSLYNKIFLGGSGDRGSFCLCYPNVEIYRTILCHTTPQFRGTKKKNQKLQQSNENGTGE